MHRHSLLPFTFLLFSHLLSAIIVSSLFLFSFPFTFSNYCLLFIFIVIPLYFQQLLSPFYFYCQFSFLSAIIVSFLFLLSFPLYFQPWLSFYFYCHSPLLSAIIVTFFLYFYCQFVLLLAIIDFPFVLFPFIVISTLVIAIIVSYFLLVTVIVSFPSFFSFFFLRFSSVTFTLVAHGLEISMPAAQTLLPPWTYFRTKEHLLVMLRRINNSLSYIILNILEESMFLCLLAVPHLNKEQRDRDWSLTQQSKCFGYLIKEIQ